MFFVIIGFGCDTAPFERSNSASVEGSMQYKSLVISSLGKTMVLDASRARFSETTRHLIFVFDFVCLTLFPLLVLLWKCEHR